MPTLSDLKKQEARVDFQIKTVNNELNKCLSSKEQAKQKAAAEKQKAEAQEMAAIQARIKKKRALYSNGLQQLEACKKGRPVESTNLLDAKDPRTI